EPVPRFNPNSTDPFQVDLRGRNLAALDLRDRLDDLLNASFDDKTVWPPADKRPADFDPWQILALGKLAGLGVRDLHQQGITGRGVGIAILDSPLVRDHQEFGDRLRWYEDLNLEGQTQPHMHGNAIASIAAGRNCGVAPEAEIYYIATWIAGTGSDGRDFTSLAQGIRRILEINSQLPADRKIRVISASVGWLPTEKAYADVSAAAAEAKAAGLLFVSSSVEQVHGFKFHGLGRAPMADPDQFESYEPGMFWAKPFFAGARFTDRLLVPMDSRTTASPTGPADYVYYRHGGWSWAAPYIAGLYALAAQVDPAITPDRFWSLAMKTGRTIKLKYGDEEIPFGPIADPVALIAEVKR
ncbi:MAG: S8/S53 family peptidase, partial [Acidobacteria bacterium]|nr:S8/S53 family peptidase [Acidobacteriota bacterium]